MTPWFAWFVGGLGNDVLDSGAGDDTLYGGTEGDKLWGDEGNDMLYGGRWNSFYTDSRCVIQHRKTSAGFRVTRAE